MREQLEYLMDRVGHEFDCPCAKCRRYWQVRALLLSVFEGQAGADVCDNMPQPLKAAG
jgi:hypothetical protein